MPHYSGLGLSRFIEKEVTLRWSMVMGDALYFRITPEIDRHTLRGALRDADINEESFLDQV